MRRLSYQENSPLLGPTVDPEGWYSKTPVTATGTLFNHRVAHIGCTVSFEVALQSISSTLFASVIFFKLFLARPVSINNYFTSSGRSDYLTHSL